MPEKTRVVSAVLLAVGVGLVFIGVSTALGFTPGGIIATIAAIVTLLYAGAVWFGRLTSPPGQAAPGEPVIVFDRSLRVVCGTGRGTAVMTQFPEGMHAEVRAHCAAALAGHNGRFECRYGRVRVPFDAVPVRSGDGAIAFGMLVSGRAAEVRAASGEPRTAAV